MSDSQAVEEQTTTVDGVAVTKRFETDEFPVPAVAFEFESTRETPVTVRVIDTVPETVDIGDLGFHPEYGSEFWIINDNQIIFERRFAPGEEYTTVYGVRATDADSGETFMTEPTVETVSSPDDGSETTETGGGDDSDGTPIESAIPGETNVVRDALGGDSSVPGLDDEQDDPIDIDLDVDIDETDDTEADTVGEDGHEESEEGTDQEQSAAPAAGESDRPQAGPSAEHAQSLVGELAGEIERGAVTDEELDRLRGALGVEDDDGSEASAGERDGAVTAKLDRLQADIADLRAYTGALEEFLAENGTGEQLVEDIEATRDRLDELGGQLEETEESVAAVREDLTGVEEAVGDLEGTVESVEDQLEEKAAASRVEGVEETADELDGRLETKADADELADLRERLDELEEFREQIVNTFG
ncbi:hypothetical protein BRC62_01865 [Halobacteriales archaeon QH_10_67_13]|nr:MAG: hypothetical protein BRC62_01865 [Halobacteriales archaeon QH_10_67_13]